MIQFFKELKKSLDYAVYHRSADAKGMRRMSRRITTLTEKTNVLERENRSLKTIIALQEKTISMLKSKNLFPTMQLIENKEAIQH